MRWLFIILLFPIWANAADRYYQEGQEKLPFSQAELEAQEEEANKSNNAGLLFSIGYAYETGELFKPDSNNRKVAIRFYKKAAKLGHTPAQAYLGRLYKLEKSYQSAKSWLFKAAKLDHPMALYELADNYARGLGTFKNIEKSFEYYYMAARLGYAPADIKVAEYFIKGIGVDKNLGKALPFLEKIERRTTNKQRKYTLIKQIMSIYKKLGTQYYKDKIFAYYKTLAKMGDVKSQLLLANIYRNKKDPVKAIELYEKAGANGNTKALNILGYIYTTGTMGKERDLDLARRYYVQGAEAGDANSAWHLGNFYYNGYGVTKDIKTAKKWFKRSRTLSYNKKNR